MGVNGPSDAEREPRKFLIVDDHAGFRRILRDFLPAGRITECASGLEAMEAYPMERPDWVLMDIEMAGMDGLTATRRLLERFPDARVILVSNYPPEEFQEVSRKVGSYGFVHKSHLEHLSQVIQQADLSKAPNHRDDPPHQQPRNPSSTPPFHP